MNNASYVGHDGDEGVEFPTLCSKGLDESVVYVYFFLDYSGGEFIVTICEFNELDSV